MKKLFLLLTLIASTFSAWGATTSWTTVTKTVGNLAEGKSWTNGEKYNVAIDDAITIDYGKYYTDGGGQFRYYYYSNCSTRAGYFTLTAKTGVIIQSVKFTYTGNGVLTDSCCGGNDVPEDHRFYGNATVAKEVNANSVTFYNGKKGSSTGTLYVTAFEITYIYLASPELKFAEETKTVCKNAASFINPLQNKGNGVVTYESSNTSVATVDKNNGTVTVKSVGSTTITATAAATPLYKAETKTYSLTVSDNLTPSPIAPVDITETKVVNDFYFEEGATWADASVHLNVKLNNDITLIGTEGNQKYVSWNAFRFYKENRKGEFTMQGKTGVTIKKVTFQYTPEKDKNNILCKRYYGSYGKNVAEGDRILTDTPYDVNANAVTYYTGNAGTVSGSYVDIKQYTIIYTDPSVVYDKIASYSSGNTTVSGDNGIYSWKVNGTNHTSEAIYDYKAIKLAKGQSIVMNGSQEGGIKTISFDYRSLTAGAAIAFTVKAGETMDDYTHASIKSGKLAHVLCYAKDFDVTSNTTCSITVSTDNSKADIAVGHIHITPYLLFNVPNHAATFNIEQGTTCDLNSALINNTGENKHTFSILENTAGGNPTITDGILDFSSVVRTGTIKVQAKWGDVTTTLTLTINLKDPDAKFAKTTDTKMISDSTYKQELNKGLSSGAVTYSLSAPEGATIAADGTVTFSTAGEYVVNGMVAAALPYAEDTASYTLTVTDLNVPELKFDTSYVEKPVGAADFTNELTTTAGIGDTTYTSSAEAVATVNNGLVHIIGAGTTTIKAATAQTAMYAAGEATYTLKVFPLPVMSMGNDTNVYLNAPNFIRTASVTAGDGEISYSSSDDSKATVNASTGEVHIVGSGSVVITATMAKSANYWSGTANYTLNVSSLKMPTASFGTETVVNKVQDFESFIKTVETESDGTKHYSSSDTRVATVNETTGEVTKGEKPGSTIIKVKIDASDTYEKIEASYTLNVSSAPIADLHTLSSTITALKTQLEWPDAPAAGQSYSDIPLNDVLTLSSGKHLYENVYGTGKTDLLRYYQKYAPDHFTIQAKAGVIIQTVKFTYKSQNSGTLATKTGTNIAVADRYESGTTYSVDANSFTCYFGNTGTGTDGRADVTDFEITYFDPATGVAVTKTTLDLATENSWTNEQVIPEVKINQAVSLKSTKNLKYYTSSHCLHSYGMSGAIDLVARPGAKIHYVKFTYTINGNGTLTKYFGTDGKNIPAVDRIASDSILYVNADSVRFYVGTTSDNYQGTMYLSKIYVNYTDNSEVVVDNFDNCEPKGIGAGGTVNVEGVDGKYDWTISNFARDNAQRMYYDQSIKLNKGGKISTQYTGGLKEIAFDWHPTEKNKAVKFTVKAGGETYIVEKAAVDTIRPYTFNFQKTAIKSNGEFSIAVDNASGTQVEIGHVSLTPYIIYTDKEVEIAAKDYKDAGYKFANSSLINYTGETVAYSITGDASIAEVNPTSGEVTIKGGGTVTVNATADGATASYKLTINLESTSAVFNEHIINRVGAGSYQQDLHITTEATEGNVVTYSFVGDHEGATIDSSTGDVTYSQAGQFKIKGELAQNMPYAAAADTFILSVTSKEVPGISYPVTAISRKVEDGVFTNELSSKAGVGDTTYVSTDPVVATVDANGEVTPLQPGVTIIKAIVAESENYAADTAWYTLTVLGKPVPGVKSVDGNIAAIADRDGWEDDKYYSYFKLDDVISVSDSNRLHLNLKYLESEECVRFYQNQTKGQFFVRAKAGAIIQTIKFTYTSQNDGVITNNYGADGDSIVAANQYLSGVTYKTDANKLVFYTGSTTDKTNGEVHITGIAVKYFDPDKGVEVTKKAIDLGKQYGLKKDTCYQNIALNNVITLHADTNNTMRYVDYQQFNCYNSSGPIYLIAREGATINYVKVTYADGNGVLTENVGGGTNLSPAQYIASDSIMEVNAQSLRLYIGSKGASYQTLAISKFYVNYTDSKSIVDNFDNCTKIYGGDAATKVMGVDSTFEWEFTQFNRDSLRRMGYDQAMMLRQAGGKIAANNVDGGIKEVSFDWFASNSNQGAKFYVKAGETTDTVQLAATGSWYPRTYTLTDIKTNGAFSIEMDPASGSQMEVGHISLTPYLFYKEKEATVTVGGTYKNESLVDFRDSNEAITYSSSKDSVATVDSTGLVTAIHVGEATITASWNGVTTSYTLTVEGDKTTIVLKRNDETNDADTLINNYGEAMPAFTLPTREGWRFNAYFPDATASKQSERITVSAWDKTYWVANVKHSNPTVTMTDSLRNWVYDRPNYTLYAQWMPELTIVLDNQEATSAGTEQVKTAKCPYNEQVNLSQNITVPVKDGFTFLGYFTADSVKVIGANGAFLANVAGYTNSKKMWQKDEGVTLYAHWELKTITLSEAENNATKIAENDGEVFGQVNLVRTLAAGKYNTFCLPFDITKADLATALNTEIVSLATLNENSAARLEDNKLFIVAKELEDDDVMQAGKPYLLQIAEQVTNPSFSNVTINKANEHIESSDGSVLFYGITSPFTVPVDNRYLFMSNNLLNWNNTGAATDMNGLRAYFYVPGMVNPSQVSARLVFKLPNTPTDLNNVNANVNEIHKMIINNQLIIIRNGVHYNANGQLIK